MRDLIKLIEGQTSEPTEIENKNNLLKEFSKKKVNEMAKRVSPEEFVDLVKKSGNGNRNLTLAGLQDIARQYDTQIPTGIRHGDTYKVSKSEWNFGTPEEIYKSDKPQLAADLGDEINDDLRDVPRADSDFIPAINLAHAKTKQLLNLQAKNKIQIMGKRPKGSVDSNGKPNSGHFFKIPGAEVVLAQLERLLAKQLEDPNSDEDLSMEEQYDDLEEKVRLVAEGRSTFMKSILITGAPSSGKTFNVMRVIKELGLKEGTDYIKKTGSITVPSMYRTLLQKINGLVIFDDCDNVVHEDNGINILKGALDTTPIREISLDNKRMVDVDGFSTEKRNEYALRLSRILNDEPFREEDYDFFMPIAKRYGVKWKVPKMESAIINSKLKKLNEAPDDDDDEDFDDGIELDKFGNPIKKGKSKFADDDEMDADMFPGQSEIITFITNRLPNKFDFQGRVIFISNLDQDEWDSAILTRAFTIQMNFKSTEMLDFIDKIKQNIRCSITEGEKQECMDYLRELYLIGKVKKPINFRLIQSIFDMRLTPNWKRMIANNV